MTSKAAKIWEDARNGDNESLAVNLAGATSADLNMEVRGNAGTGRGDPYHQCTALMIAAFYGHSETVKMLITAGVKVNQKSSEIGVTALYYASQIGHTTTVQVLLDARVDINVPNTMGGGTALTIASEMGRTTTVQALVVAGADINLPNDSGMTALIYACVNGHTAVVQVLLEAEADVNAKTKYSCTALMFASERGLTTIVQMLLGANADANAQNQWGNTAASISSNADIAALFTEHVFDSLSTQLAQVPPLISAIQQREDLFHSVFVANAEFDVNRVSEALNPLKAAIAAVVQQPLSEEDYLTLKGRHAALLENLETKCLELAEAKNYESLLFYGTKLDELKALDVSILPQFPKIFPDETSLTQDTPLSLPTLGVAGEGAVLEGDCNSIRAQRTQLPSIISAIQQREELFCTVFVTNAEFDVNRVSEALNPLKAAIAAVVQQPLSEEDYLTLKGRHAALMTRIENKCRESAAAHDFKHVVHLLSKLEELKALDVSDLPQSSNTLPSATSHVRECVVLEDECNTLIALFQQVPLLRDAIQHRDQLQKEVDDAKAIKNFVALCTIGPLHDAAIAAVKIQPLSEEDLLSLRDRRAVLVARIEAKCGELAAACAFKHVVLLLSKLEELKKLDESALPQSWINDPVMPHEVCAPSTQVKVSDGVNVSVISRAVAGASIDEDEPDWINDPVMPPAAGVREEEE